MSSSPVPLEIWKQIVAHLSKRNRKIFSEVCRDFYELSQSLIWNDIDFVVSKSAVSRLKLLINKPIKHLYLTLSANNTLKKGTALFKLIGTMDGLESLTLKLLFKDEWDDPCEEINRTFVTDTALSHLQSLTNLKVLHLERQRGITAKGLRYLVDLPIEDLSLRNMVVTDDWLTEINKIKPLKRLDVVYDLTDPAVFLTENDPEDLNYGLVLESHPDLEYFRLPDTFVNDETFEQVCALKNFKGLVVLDFKKAEKIPQFISSLKWKTKLEKLDIRFAKLNDVGSIREILGCSNLQCLSLQSCILPISSQKYPCTLTTLVLHFIDRVDFVLESLGVTPSLRSLDVSHTDLTDSGFKHLRNFANLRVFKMNSVDDFEASVAMDGGRAAVLNILATFGHLRHLEMDHNELILANDMHGLKLQAIETLSVESVPLGGDVIKFFSQMEKLRHLNLNGCKGVGLRGLSHLSKLPLRSLQMQNVKATEKFLVHIYRMKTLERLGILRGNPRLVYGKAKWLNSQIMEDMGKELVQTIRSHLPYIIVE